MRETRKAFSEERVTTAFTAFSEFLSQPCCRRCEVLELCLKRLSDDVRERGAAFSEDLRCELRRTVPFPVSHTSEGCGRCGPAEVFMAYLTPGEDIPRPQHGSPAMDGPQR